MVSRLSWKKDNTIPAESRCLASEMSLSSSSSSLRDGCQARRSFFCWTTNTVDRKKQRKDNFQLCLTLHVHLVQGKKNVYTIKKLFGSLFGNLFGNFMICLLSDHSFSVSVHLLQRKRPFQECLSRVTIVQFRTLSFWLPYCLWLPNDH